MPYYVKTCHLQKYTVKYASIAVHCVTLPHWYGNSCAIWDHAVLPTTWHDMGHSCLYPAKAGTRFSDRGGMQG